MTIYQNFLFNFHFTRNALPTYSIVIQQGTFALHLTFSTSILRS